jgi:hypothetical protein
VLLADSKGQVAAGKLELQIHLPSTAKRAILEFITRELSNWRDHPERPSEQAEDRLTEHLCDYLNSAAYHSTDLDHIQFRTETGDERNANRTIDLSVKPLGATLIIEGRRSTTFDTILPIECKRLPTPPGTDRDHREYVFSSKKTTGGIQRFKEGNHAAAHNLAAMIGYVQQGTPEHWTASISEWINDLTASSSPGWSASDLPRLEHHDVTRKVSVLRSRHTRAQPLEDIELHHVWVQMI